MERRWRLLATAFSFAVFGAAALLVSIVILLPVYFLCRNGVSRQRFGRSCVAGSFRALLWFLEVSRVFDFELDHEGLGKLSAGNGKIVVANHPTFIDVVVLLSHIDQANCVVKEAVWRNPFLGWPVRLAGYIPNAGAEHLLQACEKALRQGETLILFPEATRTVPGQPIRLQRGAASIALRTRAPLHIVHIKCEPAVLSKGDPWYRAPEGRPRFSARVGRRIEARDYLTSEDHHIAVAARRLTSVLQSEFVKEIRFDEGAGTRAEAATH